MEEVDDRQARCDIYFWEIYPKTLGVWHVPAFQIDARHVVYADSLDFVWIMQVHQKKAFHPHKTCRGSWCNRKTAARGPFVLRTRGKPFSRYTSQCGVWNVFPPCHVKCWKNIPHRQLWMLLDAPALETDVYTTRGFQCSLSGQLPLVLWIQVCLK